MGIFDKIRKGVDKALSESRKFIENNEKKNLEAIKISEKPLNQAPTQGTKSPYAHYRDRQAETIELVELVNEMADTVNKTTDPKDFFNCYDTMISFLEELTKEKYKKFVIGNPQDDLNRLHKEKEKTIELFINRSYEKLKQDIKYINSSEEKKSKVDLFYSSIEQYKDKMPQSNMFLLVELAENLDDDLCTPKTLNKISKSELEIKNEEYLKYRNKIEKDFEAKYDFYSLQGITKIPNIPENKDTLSLGTSVDKIECYLWKKSGEHEKNGNIELAIACLRKANAIMPNSSIDWQQKDYLRLVRFLRKHRKYEEAEIEEIKIKNKIPTESEYRADLSLQVWSKTLQLCKEFKTDLVKMSHHNFCCGECAKYQGRIFSITGKDKRFPKLPDIVLKIGKLHEGCRHNFSSYIYGVNHFSIYNSITGKWDDVDPIRYSNRPFIDDRSEEDIRGHGEYLTQIRNEKEKEVDRPIYDMLQRYLPDVAPKSFGAFRRMKNAKSKNYLKLIEIAKQQGIIIED